MCRNMITKGELYVSSMFCLRQVGLNQVILSCVRQLKPPFAERKTAQTV